MGDRLKREAPAETREALRRAFQETVAEHGLEGDWHAPFMAKVADVLGPVHRESIGDFGVRFIKLQAESDGYHEYVTMYF